MADDRGAPPPQAQAADDPAPRWKLFTHTGNTRFARGDMAGALSSYAQARELALARFGQWADADDAVAAIVVSYLNLSEAQAGLALLDEAAATLNCAHAGLLQMAGDTQLGTAVQRAARRHLGETYAALLRFQGLHGERPELMQWLHRGCACAAHAERATDSAASAATTLH
jgi:hypothetical protein